MTTPFPIRWSPKARLAANGGQLPPGRHLKTLGNADLALLFDEKMRQDHDAGYAELADRLSSAIPDPERKQ